MRLGRIGTVVAALAGGLVLAAPAQAFEFNEIWGYGYVDDNPFVNPDTGRLGTATQVFPRGVIRDVRPPDDRDVRLTVLVFMPGDPAPQDSCVATEGDFVDQPFGCPIDIAPRQISQVLFAFCRFYPSTGPDTDCRYKTFTRPPTSRPGGSGGGGGGGGGPATPAPTDPDRDGDGVPASQDCEDNNARVRPGAPEIAGNAIDDDCRNGDKPARITAEVSRQFKAWRKFTRVLGLRVRDAPAGATVTVRCLGKRPRCKLRRATVAANGTVNLKRRVPRRLRVGTRLEVRIVALGWIGKVLRYRIKPGESPPPRRLCLPPGAKKPKRC